ncbi:MAG TPA: response regulator [Chthoniobacteraceae bacterium]|nr:response regulator [Chthoniobacteraceae bacterium]
MKPRALVIDDEIQIRRLLRVALEGAGYEVHEADGGQLGLQAAAVTRPDVILLDLGLPDLDGLSVLHRLREWSRTPVVVLTVRSSEQDKVIALDSGADDYVTKPFSTAELLARMRAAQRRAQPHEESSVFSQGAITVDLVARTVHRDGVEVKLTATEWSLFALLIRHAGRILTHRQILREVWGPKAEEHREYLRVYFTHLRKKVERDPTKPELIINEPGIGYRLQIA